jgi:hypothetical protein
MRIIPIVEGHGEEDAVPVLLRRLQETIGDYSFQIAHPIRGTCSDLADAGKLAKKVAIALRQRECAGIFIIFDSDDRCPKKLAPRLHDSARNAAAGVPCELTMAHREFESWFLAAFESIRGSLPFVPNAAAPDDPEGRRDAKGTLTGLLPPGRSYSPTVDQAALARRFDLAAAYRASRSFRHCADAFFRLATVIGTAAHEWPPRDWR